MSPRANTNPYVFLTDAERKAIVEARLRDAERQAFDAELNLEVELAATGDGPDATARVAPYRQNFEAARARVAALQARGELKGAPE